MTLLQQHIANGYIRETKHPSLPLYIYCYTNLVQYDRVWDEVTLTHRGIIKNELGNIVSRPFKKFFNMEEVGTEAMPSLPNGPYTIYEKYDGSFIISYFVNGVPYLASKGSFTSDQAVYANNILCEKYPNVVMNPAYTYIFELIYPTNRIVVDYGGDKDLILLAVINTETGEELPLDGHGFPVAKTYPSDVSLAELKAQDVPNREGYVLKYEDGTRIKIKFETYLKLHRVLTNTSSYDIWEYMRDGREIAPLLEKVPDEFFSWVKYLIADLTKRYEWLEKYARHHVRVLRKNTNVRKEQAEYVKGCIHPSLVFAALDGKDLSPMIWNLIKPKYEKPFSNEHTP